MNSKTWTRFIALLVIAALARSIGLAAQDDTDGKLRHHHYKLIDVGTFGGPNAYLSAPLPSEVQVNRHGLVAGAGKGRKNLLT